MGLQPRRINGLIKREMAARKMRYNVGEIELAADAERENRKAPSKKLAGRMGLAPYYDADIKTFVEYQADQVSIPLKMAVGAPCVPCVKKGDKVKAGDVIAEVPENALGARIHASIDGKVAAIDDKITIIKE
jgi:biotin carboxyl carrier protein